MTILAVIQPNAFAIYGAEYFAATIAQINTAIFSEYLNALFLSQIMFRPYTLFTPIILLGTNFIFKSSL